MIAWKNVKKMRPENKQSCFITQEANGLSTFPIIGPIFYEAKADLFMDLWATPEAGACYPIKELDLWWCPEEDINLPDSGEAPPKLEVVK